MRLVWQRVSCEGHLSCQRLSLPEGREKGPFFNRLSLRKCSPKHRAGARFPGPHGDDGFIQVGSRSLRGFTDPGLQRHGSGRDCYPGATIPKHFKHVVLTSSDRSLLGPDGKTLRISGLARLYFKAQRPRKREKRLHPTWSTHGPTCKPAITNLGLFPSVNNVLVPLPLYEEIRADL
ncbi:hypothetical protein HPB48_011180 [Haemaphysalis longicornis]|uniref:Uncharacterized protein n=1 Tax=Haemaphysalis longicornis TaxID=44386 RepID=A0A9J6GX02_HAELO|nr:hypothetical protein HPB48_011180 [Haemaphysalis longicornis]